MGMDSQRLTIIGDIGIDLVMGPVSGWPRLGTETMMERSELRPGGSAANAALAVASGEHTKSEDLGYGDLEFVPWQIGAVM